MKKSIIILTLFSVISFSFCFGQDTIKENKQAIVYTFFYNMVPDHSSLPLVGFINTALGDHKGAQVGYINTTLGNFSGGQIGFINTNIKTSTGAQVGYVNTSLKELNGTQIGFVNTTLKEYQGAQIGYVNTAIGDSKGPQIGFVNTCAKSIEGSQIGYVNVTAKTLTGFQLGFVNFADSIEKGVPVGFISVVRKNGYQAFELSTNPAYALNFSFKIGVPQFYTSFILSANPGSNISWGSGMGIGSNLYMTEKVYLNIEGSSVSKIGRNFNSTNQLSLGLGFDLTSHLSLSAGLGVVHQFKDRYAENFDQPFYSLFEYDINENNRLLSGIHAGISFRL